jgi:hypothetical protein
MARQFGVIEMLSSLMEQHFLFIDGKSFCIELSLRQRAFLTLV